MECEPEPPHTLHARLTLSLAARPSNLGYTPSFTGAGLPWPPPSRPPGPGPAIPPPCLPRPLPFPRPACPGPCRHPALPPRPPNHPPTLVKRVGEEVGEQQRVEDGGDDQVVQPREQAAVGVVRQVQPQQRQPRVAAAAVGRAPLFPVKVLARVELPGRVPAAPGLPASPAGPGAPLAAKVAASRAAPAAAARQLRPASTHLYALRCSLALAHLARCTAPRASPPPPPAAAVALALPLKLRHLCQQVVQRARQVVRRHLLPAWSSGAAGGQEL